VTARKKIIDEYIVSRLRFCELQRLDYLLDILKYKKVSLPSSTPYTNDDLADTVRTALFGWFASLLDLQSDSLNVLRVWRALFPQFRGDIERLEQTIAPHEKALKGFRNKTAFHADKTIEAHFDVRQELRKSIIELRGAIHDFIEFSNELQKIENQLIPELATKLQETALMNHPAFKA
jgi:hypothetical protein